MADQVPVQKKTRKTLGPKVTSGCITCKKRRVKCDELHPYCKRCEKFGAECEGYTKAPAAADSRRHIARPLLPNTKVLCRPPATVSQLFSSNQEFGYFQRFCIQNVRQLTGLQESELWSRHVLQASEMEPCVRHAVMAIGALDFSKRGLETGGLKMGQRGSGQVATLEPFETNRLEFAYREYGKAISCLKAAIAQKKLSIRTSLLTSLLFICFETYHGNSDSASAQVYAGLEVMDQYSRQRKLEVVKPNTLIPPPIDDDIVEMFSMLEIQATSWGDKRRSSLHLQRKQDCEAAIGKFPREFKDQRHASRTLNLIGLRGIHLRLSEGNKGIVPSSEESTRAAIITLGPLVSEPQHAELRSVLSMFRQWAIAYEPYLRSVRGSGSNKERKDGASMLYMHYLAMSLWVAPGAPTLDSYYRCHTKELQELVSLSKAMSIENQDFFSLEFRIVMPLQVVALNYRHRTLRREALTIFSSVPRREGMWDATMVTKVLEWISAIEEEGLGDEEYVPEDGIATMTALKVDAENRSAYVQCIQGVRGCQGQTILKENTVYW